MTLLSMIRGFSFAILVVLSGYAYAQSCSQNLKTAEDLFEAGRLLEIEKVIKDCLASTGSFTEAEEIRARKLLTKVAIFTDNEARAEQELVELLHLDPVHRLQPEDPSELSVLLKKFRTWPVYRLEFKLGGNYSLVGIPQQFSVFTPDASEKDYGDSPGIGFQVEADITKHLKKGIEVGAGIQFRASKYTVLSALPGDLFETNVTNSQSTIRLPVFGRYNFNYTYQGERRLTPYVFAGVSLDYLLKASYTEASRSGGTAVSVNASDADLKALNQVNNINFSLFGGAGLKIALKKGNYFFGEVRFDKGMKLYNVPEERYANSNLVEDLQYVEDDVYLNFLSVNVGLIKSIFKPEKLTK